jgi:hypothetical protein
MGIRKALGAADSALVALVVDPSLSLRCEQVAYSDECLWHSLRYNAAAHGGIDSV